MRAQMRNVMYVDSSRTLHSSWKKAGDEMSGFQRLIVLTAYRLIQISFNDSLSHSSCSTRMSQRLRGLRIIEKDFCLQILYSSAHKPLKNDQLAFCFCIRNLLWNLHRLHFCSESLLTWLQLRFSKELNFFKYEYWIHENEESKYLTFSENLIG